MADRAIWWRIVKRFVARAFDGMCPGNGVDQIVMVAGFTINQSASCLAIGDGLLNFIGKGADIDTFGIGWRTGAVCRVGVATGAIVFVNGMDAGKVGGV